LPWEKEERLCGQSRGNRRRPHKRFFIGGLRMSYGIIYKATCPIGKIYIGQTVKSLTRRIRNHKYQSLKEGTHSPFHESVLAYGIEAFAWEQIDTAGSKAELDSKEKHWIALYDSMNPDKGYNNQSGGINKYTLSTETLKKFSMVQEGEKNPMYGKHHSEETRKKMSKSLKGIGLGKRKRVTEQYRQKLSEALKGNQNARKASLKKAERVGANVAVLLPALRLPPPFA
jgi:group I intron endonuclease